MLTQTKAVLDAPFSVDTSLLNLKVLFVDDEIFILKSLERNIGRKTCWDIEYALSVDQAIDLLKEEHYDVVVTDMRMPGRNGGELLEYIKENHPKTVRILLSGYADSYEEIDKSLVGHRFLQKPCLSTDIIELIQSAIEAQVQ